MRDPLIQSGLATEHIISTPHREQCSRGNHLWLLRYDAYGLLDASSKLQVQSVKM